MTPQYSPSTQTLFLIICSGTKNDQAPGSGLYREETSITSRISPEAKASLMKGRNQALNLIYSESNSDQRLRDHPYNARIKPGKDFGNQESDARYIPAMWLYRGRFYFNLEESGKKALLSSEHHCLILSGLFGLVTPTEFIQLYECPLEDVPVFSTNWQQDNLLTGVLLDYITRNDIKNCIDLTSQQEYREMINWNLLRTKPDLHILHAHSKNFVSHEALPDLGIFLKKVLIHLTDDQFQTISDKQEWKSLALTTQIIPPDGWPMEESRRIDKLIKNGESQQIEYKAGLIGSGFNDLPKIVNNDMKYRVMKGICSFLNTAGGEMLIGVDDSQKIIGVSSELRTLKYSNNPEDEYNQIFEQMVVNYLGRTFLPQIKLEYRTIQKKVIVLIKVVKSKKPAYIRISKTGKPTKEYWIRGNCSCRELKNADISSHMKEIGQELS